MPISLVENTDNMKFMKGYPDGFFDLAVCDPPYGIGEKFKGGKTGAIKLNNIPKKGWDIAPNKEYFDELFRVSKNQIIWGGNYFNIGPTRCYIIWDKCISEDFSMAMAEIAWTSFDQVIKIFKYYQLRGNRIHDTQKPIQLYKWLLENHAKPNDKILDTHLGSGSSRIAAYDLGFDFYACELDKDYFEAQEQRFKKHISQQRLFTPSQLAVQTTLL